MSIEHEQRCERTIVTTVHEIDGLKRQLAEALAAIERARELCTPHPFRIPLADFALRGEVLAALAMS
ncbi:MULTISPECIES: hypothetical protein [unclassified Rhodococcus (in: high G+C Gram-positive bacteria)]|uniref:hypothetical protein n=1 Tax=unclassified Rhodococcus (in: high G+C Gram-positive bacteria) TaxID=192944 RepID=UPI000B9B0528|nr:MULTISPECIES: hypothetical protein [unclassified Rhodococcus (in: high G+C Gram-positive bacteria)]OZE35637.1 hypothetical protein CH259_16555 [Rhodococcus sp. 05-2254-4]OZE48066.1 hypothetical protein CH261_09150 [Rhodococcus sp. 05-2254-3]OZE49277.1 hypothetical protein CH283_16935 [Rhodococcus sp. 05-2254-2]